MRVAIVGGAKSTQGLAPFDEDCEIWVLGNQIQQYDGKRVSKIFELHDNLSEHDPRYAEYIAKMNIPMVVSDQFPIKADHIEIFPYEQAERFLGDYFTSSGAFMVAYALLNGVTRLECYGWQMATNDHEYFKQRACFEAWLGFAKGRGVDVVLPEECPILKSRYNEGRHWNNVDKGPFTEEAFLKKAKEHQEQCDYHKMMLNTHDGSRQAFENLAKVARAYDAGDKVSFGAIIGD